MEENKITKVLYNQVTLAIAVIGAISTFIFWVTNPTNLISQRVGSLEQSFEYQTSSLNEIKKKLDSIDERQLKLLESVARLEAIHK